MKQPTLSIYSYEHINLADDTYLNPDHQTLAKHVGIYSYLWEPHTAGVHLACDLIVPLQQAINTLRADPLRYARANGWRVYRDFTNTLLSYLNICRDTPGAVVKAQQVTEV